MPMSSRARAAPRNAKAVRANDATPSSGNEAISLLTSCSRPSATRVVSWNCRNALDAAKAERLASLGAVAAVVQECAPGAPMAGYRQVTWNGPAGVRGTGVYVAEGTRAEPLPVTGRALLWGMPVRLPSLGLDLVGVWGFKRGWQAGPPGPVAIEAIEDVSPVLAAGRAVR